LIGRLEIYNRILDLVSRIQHPLSAIASGDGGSAQEKGEEDK
jgi:hypothetical protein